MSVLDFLAKNKSCICHILFSWSTDMLINVQNCFLNLLKLYLIVFEDFEIAWKIIMVWAPSIGRSSLVLIIIQKTMEEQFL